MIYVIKTQTVPGLYDATRTYSHRPTCNQLETGYIYQVTPTIRS